MADHHPIDIDDDIELIEDDDDDEIGLNDIEAIRREGLEHFSPLVHKIVSQALLLNDIIHAPTDPDDEYRQLIASLRYRHLGVIVRPLRPIPGLRHHYLAYSIGGERFQQGQALALRREKGSTRSPFVRIIYFVDKLEGSDAKITTYAHCQIYVHARRTWDGDMANPREVHESDQCEDILVKLLCLSAKINISSRDDFEKLPRDDQVFYCQTRVATTAKDTPEGSFVECTPLPDPEVAVLGLPQCPACAIRLSDIKAEVCSIDKVGKQMTVRGIPLHVHDFVFFQPDAPGLYGIGQVMALPSSESGSALVGLRILRRWDDVARDKGWRYKDEKLVFFSGIDMQVPALTISRRVVVLNSDDITKVGGKHVVRLTPDCFYLMEQLPIIVTFPIARALFLTTQRRSKRCQDCMGEWHATEKAVHGPEARCAIKLLSLFCSAGLADLGVVGHLCDRHPIAVDNDRQALDSYEKFFPENTYVSAKNIYQVVEEAPHFQRILGTRKPTLLLATPPCQPFSKANRYPKLDDERILLPFAALSVVDVVRPSYVILECVSGLFHHRTKDRVEGRARSGVVLSAITRLLKDMGYQFRVGVMQAGYYGCPASRSRIIILAAKIGLVLPRYPRISHLFHHGKQRVNFGDDEYISADTTFAPHAAITPEDALGDLSERLVPEIHHQAGYDREPWTNFQRRARELGKRTVKMHAAPSCDMTVTTARQDPRKPFACVTTCNKQQHHRLDRLLSTRELARLQGMKDHHDLAFPEGLASSKYQQLIGNGVPVLLMESLAREFRIAHMAGARGKEERRLEPIR